MNTVPARPDRLEASLEDIRREHLDSIPAEKVADVVKRIVTPEPGEPSIDVAAFGSSI